MKNKVISLAISDFKLIFRDPSLRTFLFFPLILFALFIWFVPYLVDTYESVTPYLYLFMVIGVVENTQMFCFISSMVLIDEKETDVAKVYGVVPLSKAKFILSRLLLPFLFTVFLNIFLLKIQTIYDFEWLSIFAISILTAFIVPIYVLAINSIAENRMTGLIYIKAFNMIVLLPIAAFFVPENFKHFFGFIPTHWVFQAIDNMTKGEPILIPSLIGAIFFILLFVYVSKTFIKKHFL